MSMMKTNLTTIPMYPRERFALYKSLSRLVLCYKKDWATLLHFIYFCYLLLVTNYYITKLSITTYFSTCREYLAENRLSFSSAPCWVRHSDLSKGLRQIPYTCGSSLSKTYIWNVSTLKGQNIQFQFRNMVMISYLRWCSPTIVIICMWARRGPRLAI